MSSVCRMTGVDQFRGLFRNEKGAIDLASIMVGVIVIGLVGGVIAATVFAIIPWAQDRAAKQQVDSIVSAQSAYKGLSSGVPPAVAEGLPTNSYASSADLSEAQLLQEGDSYCTTQTDEGNGYLAVALSSSGKFFAATDANTKAYEISALDVPDGCDSFDSVDKTPTLTKLTYKCPKTTSVTVPIYDGTGTATWSDGETRTYNKKSMAAKTLEAGVEYKFTFDGTYPRFGSESEKACLVSMDHWGSETGVTDAANAFYYASNLVDVPKKIPTSITNMDAMFELAYAFNDPDVSHWDVSQASTMEAMFSSATNFNQSINKWDVSSVESMSGMFNKSAFNQPLNNWNVSKVKKMGSMFYNSPFDQPLDKWNVSSVTTMRFMFASSPFNKPIEVWNVSSVVDMSYMFFFNKSFNQPLNGWGEKVSNVGIMSNMFSNAAKFDQPLNDWNVSNVTDMSSLFYNTPFNRPLNDWKVSKVANMSSMFDLAQKFNQPLDKWDVSKVTNMSGMFSTAGSFKQPLNMWNVGNVTDMSEMFDNNYGFNQPLNSWNVSKVENMDSMFKNTVFKQDISGWNTTSLKSGKTFAVASFPDAYMPARTSK